MYFSDGTHVTSRPDPRYEIYSKPCLKRPLKKNQKLIFKTNYCLIQVKFTAEGEHSAILSTFIKLLFVVKLFILSIFEWPIRQVLLYR